LIAFNEIKTDEIKLNAAQLTTQKESPEAAFQLMYQPVLDGEPWAIDYFFEILSNISMRSNLYNVAELLNTNNKTVYNKTIVFLNKLTNLRIKVHFDDSQDKKTQTKQTFLNWYQEHYQEFK
jgi:hypothetical protein